MKPDLDLRKRSKPESGRRVLVLTEHLNATYFLSFHFALNALHERGLLDYCVSSQASHARTVERAGSAARAAHALLESTNPTDIVFSRFASPSGLEVANAARERGLPLIYHIDDDLLNLPASLGERVLAVHGAPEVIGTRRSLMEQADLVYASTETLAAKLQSYFPSQTVKWGMYAPVILKPRRPKRRPGASTKFVVGYMGSRGHADDLAMIEPAIAALMQSRPQVEFQTFGTIKASKAFEKSFRKRYAAHGVERGYKAFLRRMADLSWDLGLAPLRSNDFNLCKAPTKYIEYSSAGIPTLASRVDVYSQVIRPGTGLLVDDEFWLEHLTRATDGEFPLGDWARNAAAFCSTEFSLARLERQVLEVMDGARAKAEIRAAAVRQGA